MGQKIIYNHLVVSLPGKTCVARLLLFFKIFNVASNRKWTCRRIKTVLHDTFFYTDALCQISGSWPLWFPIQMWQKISCHQICLCPQYSKSRKIGNGHASDSKMRYTIQFSILMLCAKYQEGGLCGSREKCDRNDLVSKFVYVRNILSRVKQEVDMRQIKNCVTRYSSPYCVTRYSSPYWCSMPNIRKLTQQ